MHSLAQEIHGFAKDRLKKQSTRVTTVTGKKLLERRSDGGEGDVELVEELEEGNGCGFVEDNSLDLQVGVVRPFLLLGSQDAAHDIDTLQRYKVSHVLNVAYGVDNLFPDTMVYKTLQILDLPETEITSYFEECSSFIDQTREQVRTHRIKGSAANVSVPDSFRRLWSSCLSRSELIWQAEGTMHSIKQVVLMLWLIGAYKGQTRQLLWFCQIK
uniref:Dual specificity phosphatase 19b n=1 Tax=Neolamprologus brichardi TaxID=32507 RepID=A0A3Q4GNG1_NEOBR